MREKTRNQRKTATNIICTDVAAYAPFFFFKHLKCYEAKREKRK